jgi:hypothetical protein
MKMELLDLYSDYLLSSFGATSATHFQETQPHGITIKDIHFRFEASF